MLLRVGALMMVVAVALTIGVAVVVTTREEPEERDVAAQPVAAEPTVAESSLYPETQPKTEDEPREEPTREEPEPAEEPAPSPPLRPESQAETLPATEQGWELPDEQEIALADEPRYYDPGPQAALALTIPALGVYDAPVLGSDSSQALDQGVVHVPETSMPWDGGAQRNVYLAAHRLGYEGTGSRLIFYNLDDLQQGDEVILEGRGQVYRYRVREVFVVGPYDSWVMGQVRDRDMVTLQTCTPIPTFENRLIVRADRI